MVWFVIHDNIHMYPIVICMCIDVYKSIKSLCVSKKPVSLELDKVSYFSPVWYGMNIHSPPPLLCSSDLHLICSIP